MSNVALIATMSTGAVANSVTDDVAINSYDRAMLNEWLRSALETAGLGQAALSRELTARLGRAIDRAAVNKMVSGKRQIAADELLEIARVTGVAAPSDDENDGFGIVAVIGDIAAGGRIEVNSEDFNQAEPLFEIKVPFQVPSDAVALRVNGDSMWPRYDPGDVIICYRYSEDPRPLIGFEAAIGTPDGNRYLKRLLRGSAEGLFNLESHNAGTMRDVQIAWASEVYGVVRAARWEKLNDAGRRRAMKKAVA